jgi:hypothetical protein
MYRGASPISINIANLLKTREQRETGGAGGDDAATVAAMDGKVRLSEGKGIG